MLGVLDYAPDMLPADKPGMVNTRGIVATGLTMWGIWGNPPKHAAPRLVVVQQLGRTAEVEGVRHHPSLSSSVNLRQEAQVWQGVPAIPGSLSASHTPGTA